MSEINRNEMLDISDRVVKQYLETADKSFIDNPFAKPFISAISDIAALVVLEYHKKLNEKV